MIHWVSNDLRTDENEALTAANGGAAALLPVYVFDPRDYQKVPKVLLLFAVFPRPAARPTVNASGCHWLQQTLSYPSVHASLAVIAGNKK